MNCLTPGAIGEDVWWAPRQVEGQGPLFKAKLREQGFVTDSKNPHFQRDLPSHRSTRQKVVHPERRRCWSSVCMCVCVCKHLQIGHLFSTFSSECLKTRSLWRILEPQRIPRRTLSNNHSQLLRPTLLPAQQLHPNLPINLRYCIFLFICGALGLS